MSSIVANSGKPLVYLSRTESFSAAHRLNSKALDEQTNREMYGKCNSIHGHNYKVEVTVKGAVDVINGMVCDISVLKSIISETVMKSLDHKNIDKEVDYFVSNDIVSSAENIAIYIWNIINERLPKNIALDSIKLHETDKNVVVFRGEFV